MRTQHGFTLIELIVVLSLVITLLGITTINLVGSQQAASLNSAVEILSADLKQQQLRSMIGDTEGRATSDSYGIHFDSNQYVFFHGTTYSASDNTNFVSSLTDDMQINHPGFNIVFSKISGEIPADTIIELKDNTNSKLKRIHLNTFGIITQVESL